MVLEDNSLHLLLLLIDSYEGALRLLRRLWVFLAAIRE